MNSMNFWCFTIHGRICRNNKENTPKYAIGQGITSPDMSPGGEGPLTKQIRPYHVEK